MRKRRFLKAAIIGLFASVGFGVLFTRAERSVAANDDVLTAISDYKSWGRITKGPFTVSSFRPSLDLTLLPPAEVRIDPRAMG